MNDEYVMGHLQEALTHAGETDVHVRVASGRVLLTGTVATESRRDIVTELIAAHTDLDVHNELTVMHCDPPGDREQLFP